MPQLGDTMGSDFESAGESGESGFEDPTNDLEGTADLKTGDIERRMGVIQTTLDTDQQNLGAPVPFQMRLPGQLPGKVAIPGADFQQPNENIGESAALNVPDLISRADQLAIQFRQLESKGDSYAKHVVEIDGAIRTLQSQLSTAMPGGAKGFIENFNNYLQGKTEELSRLQSMESDEDGEGEKSTREDTTQQISDVISQRLEGHGVRVPLQKFPDTANQHEVFDDIQSNIQDLLDDMSSAVGPDGIPANSPLGQSIEKRRADLQNRMNNLGQRAQGLGRYPLTLKVVQDLADKASEASRDWNRVINLSKTVDRARTELTNADNRENDDGESAQGLSSLESQYARLSNNLSSGSVTMDGVKLFTRNVDEFIRRNRESSKGDTPSSGGQKQESFVSTMTARTTPPIVPRQGPDAARLNPRQASTPGIAPEGNEGAADQLSAVPGMAMDRVMELAGEELSAKIEGFETFGKRLQKVSQDHIEALNAILPREDEFRDRVQNAIDDSAVDMTLQNILGDTGLTPQQLEAYLILYGNEEKLPSAQAVVDAGVDAVANMTKPVVRKVAGEVARDQTEKAMPDFVPDGMKTAAGDVAAEVAGDVAEAKVSELAATTKEFLGNIANKVDAAVEGLSDEVRDILDDRTVAKIKSLPAERQQKMLEILQEGEQKSVDAMQHVLYMMEANPDELQKLVRAVNSGEKGAKNALAIMQEQGIDGAADVVRTLLAVPKRQPKKGENMFSELGKAFGTREKGKQKGEATFGGATLKEMEAMLDPDNDDYDPNLSTGDRIMLNIAVLIMRMLEEDLPAEAERDPDGNKKKPKTRAQKLAEMKAQMENDGTADDPDQKQRFEDTKQSLVGEARKELAGVDADLKTEAEKLSAVTAKIGQPGEDDHALGQQKLDIEKRVSQLKSKQLDLQTEMKYLQGEEALTDGAEAKSTDAENDALVRNMKTLVAALPEDTGLTTLETGYVYHELARTPAITFSSPEQEAQFVGDNEALAEMVKGSGENRYLPLDSSSLSTVKGAIAGIKEGGDASGEGAETSGDASADVSASESIEGNSKEPDSIDEAVRRVKDETDIDPGFEIEPDPTAIPTKDNGFVIQPDPSPIDIDPGMDPDSASNEGEATYSTMGASSEDVSDAYDRHGVTPEGVAEQAELTKTLSSIAEVLGVSIDLDAGDVPGQIIQVLRDQLEGPDNLPFIDEDNDLMIAASDVEDDLGIGYSGLIVRDFPTAIRNNPKGTLAQIQRKLG